MFGNTPILEHKEEFEGILEDFDDTNERMLQRRNETASIEQDTEMELETQVVV